MELRLEVRDLDMRALNDSSSRGYRSVQGALPLYTASIEGQSVVEKVNYLLGQC